VDAIDNVLIADRDGQRGLVRFRYWLVIGGMMINAEPAAINAEEQLRADRGYDPWDRLYAAADDLDEGPRRR
jgi:hypothetical protein